MFQGNSVLYLKGKLGLAEEIPLAHRRYARGEITESQLNYIQIPHLSGIDLGPVLTLLESGPLLKNIQLGTKKLRDSGLQVSMLTFNPLQILFCRKFGIDCSICRSVEIQNDRIVKTNEIPENKLDYLLRYCQSHGLKTTQCIHIGDGRNDIPTFRAAGLSIALNAATRIVRDAANASMQTDDFDLVATKVIECMESTRTFSESPSPV